MWKSFIEYITSLGRWGWFVLVDIFSGISGAYLDVSGTWGFPTWLWIILLGIAFVLVPFIAFHKLRLNRDELKSELDAIRNAKSNIKVKPLISGNRAVLEVKNIGVDANFTVEAIVVKGVPPHTRYTMCWDSPPHLEHPIKNKGTSTIIVAEITSSTIGIVYGGLALYQIGLSGQIEKVGATTQELRNTVINNIRYPTMATPVDDSCIIEITITGTPPLLTPFNNRKYIVKIDHEQRHELLFTPLPESNPDKEGSQS